MIQDTIISGSKKYSWLNSTIFFVKLLKMQFKLDMKIIKPYKYEYVELYHNLEDLQTEILNFIDGKDDQNNINSGKRLIMRYFIKVQIFFIIS